MISSSSFLTGFSLLAPLFLVASVQVASASPASREHFNNPFGMQLRRLPADPAAIREPVIVREAPTNECSLVARSDGSLEIYYVTKPSSDSISMIQSRDQGLTWSEPRVEFPIPGQAYYAVQVLEADDGAMHAVFHLLGQGEGGYRGRLYEVYHLSKPRGAAEWSPPQRIVPGYVGSIRGFIQLKKTGRLVLAVARAIPARSQAPATGPDFGWHDTFVYYSDDRGATWRQSPDALRLELKTPNNTRYGAIEPALLELRDGRVWMLVRDRQGRLWQSYSADGERWSAIERTRFISSDSPAEVQRLRDGRILLLTNACQFWENPRTYAMGGREVLHAAVSRDEGVTWQGFREVFHETSEVTRGDRGSAYASAAETRAGKIAVVSGQGEGKRAIFLFDPAWLEQTTVRDDLRLGPSGWTHYGAGELKVVANAGATPYLEIPFPAAELGGALWNFPIGDRGEIAFRVRVPAEVEGLQFALNDHFNRIDDRQAVDHSVFAFAWNQPAAPGNARWHDVRLTWTDAQKQGALRIWIDGVKVGERSAQRPAEWGVNYLRVEFRAKSAEGSLGLADVVATIGK